MLRFAKIVWTSFKMALQELRSNKLRTFLSLLGITFGIFCIISVLSTISSMQRAVTNDIKSMGNKAIYISRWQWGGDGDEFPWWKYLKRPVSKYYEMEMLKQKVPAIKHIAFVGAINDVIEYEDDIIRNINYYGITEGFIDIQPLTIGAGRYFQQTDFDHGPNYIVIGNTIAENLFVKPENAVGKQVKLKNQKIATIIGVIKKKGKSMIDAWDYDNSILFPYEYFKQFAKEDNSDPNIMVQGDDNVSVDALKDELNGAMRSIRKLSPTQENNYSLNDVGIISSFLDPIFTGMNVGGWAIAALSLLVGMFGVANIMFVTVRERTSQIGLKKAIGAKRRSIMMEFLLESAFLCIIGGLIGMAAVFILTLIFSTMFSFQVFIPLNIIILAVFFCLLTGVLAGIIPALIAARMDPVVAIRSN